MTEKVDETEVELNAYNLFNIISNSARTGGVVLYFKKQWLLTNIKNCVKNAEYWISAYMAKNDNVSLIVIAIYRSPSYSKVEFCDALQEFLEEICERNCDIIIAGDFNIDWRTDFYKQRIEGILNDNGLKQIMNEATRITSSSKTTIDYIITNNEIISAKTNINNKISDHEAIDIFIECENNTLEIERKQIEIFKYEKTHFRNELSVILEYNDLLSVNEQAKNFDKCMEVTISKFMVKKQLNESSSNKWFSNELRNLKVQKVREYQRAVIENTNAAWTSYKTLRNKYKIKIENEKRNYISNKIAISKDQKEMWAVIKELVLKKPRNVIKSVIVNKVEYKKNTEIAENFNNYFVDSIKEIRSSIENVQYKNLIPVINSKFKFRAISIVELKAMFRDINNKPDYRKITKNIIMDTWDTTGNILMNIINKSLQTGHFPKSWKESMVTPVAKVKTTNKCEEFRPINGLKTCEKVMEKVVKNQLEEYLEHNSLLSKYQSGFRKKHSCETTVNYLVNRWKCVKKNNKILSIFLDFKRAFETIDRNILIQKLHRYGVQDNELDWFKSYLANREQKTKVNYVESAAIENNYGVPQGSILGALLFIVYINDIEQILEKCEIIMYADDTLIFTEAETEEICYENLTRDMCNINKWLNMNKLKLNENKTKLMEINMNTDKTFQINNITIEKIDTIKYLGFLIDKNLKFNEHIEYICKKIGKKIGFFKRLRNKVSTITSINIYNTIIKPHFEYGSTILYSSCSDQQISRLQKLQNKAMRAILKCNRLTSINLMLNTLQWLNVHQRLQLNTINFIQKLKMGDAPDYLEDQTRYVREAQPYNLRNANDFRLQQAHTSAMKRTFFYKGLRLYNLMSNEIKNEQNVILFRKKVVNFIRNNLVQNN